MSRLSKQLLGGLFLFVAMLVLIGSTAKERADLTWPERWFRDIVAPVQNVFMAFNHSVSGIVENFGQYGEWLEQRQQYDTRINELEQRVAELENQQVENIRLRRLLNFVEAEQEKYDVEPARVIGRTPRSWYKTLTINKGADAGIAKDMAVVTPKGLVGRIMDVADNSATVLMITDNRSAVGSVLQPNRTLGIVEGIGDESGLVRLVNIPKDVPIRENQVVETSSLGGVLPAGLRIGRVKVIETGEMGLLREAIIQPYVNFNNIEEVLVIKKVVSGTVPAEPEVE